MKYIIFVLLIPVSVFAQINCPDPPTGFANETFYWEEYPFDIYAIGKYEIRSNGNNFDVIIDTSSFHLNEYQFMPHEERVELMTLKIIEDIAKFNAPECGSPGAPIEIRVYNIVECNVATKCSIMVVSDDYDCDIGYTGPTPVIEDPNNDKWVIHNQTQSCGQLCCVTVYEVCSTPISPDGYPRAIIQSVTKMHYDANGCSLDGNFIDGTTMQLIPCSNGCH